MLRFFVVVARCHLQPLATDLGQHLVDGLLDVRGGAAASGLALDCTSPPHLAAHLVESLRHAAALVGARRALVECTRHLGGQSLALLGAHLSRVLQVRFVAHQHKWDVLGFLHLLQETPQRRHLLEAAAVGDVVDDDKAVPPTHVALLLQHVLLKINQNS